MDGHRKRISRRGFLQAAAVATGGVLAACAPSAPQVVEVTREVQKEVIKEVPKEVVKEVEKEVVKVVTATPRPNIANEKVSLRIGDPNGQLKALGVWENILAKFPNWDLKYEEAPFNQFRDKVLVELAGGTAPDLFLFENTTFQTWVDKGLFLAINPLIDRDGIDWNRFTVDPRVGVGLDGVAYGLQQCLCDMPGIIYNKEAFREAGLPTLPMSWEEGFDTWTWQDEIELSLALTKRRADGTVERYGRLNPTAINMGFEAYVWGNGGDILNTPWNYRNATECLIDRPEAIEAMQHIYDLTHKYKVTPAPEQAQDMFDLESFFSGRVAISQYYVQYDLIAKAPFEFGVYWTPSPRLKYGMHYNCHPRVIPTSSKQPDAAWEILKQISFDRDNLRLISKRFRQAYDTWALIGELTDPGLIETEKVVVARLKEGDMSNQKPWHYGNRAGPQVGTVLSNTVQSILLNKVGLEEGLKDGKKEIDRLLQEAAQQG